MWDLNESSLADCRCSESKYMVALDECLKTYCFLRMSPGQCISTVPALESDLWLFVTFIKASLVFLHVNERKMAAFWLKVLQQQDYKIYSHFILVYIHVLYFGF